MSIDFEPERQRYRSAAARSALRARRSRSSGQSVLEAKRPYVTAVTLQDYATQGRKRLLPWFGDLRLVAIACTSAAQLAQPRG